MMVRMKELEAENKRLKKMYAEMSMQNDLIKEAMANKWSGRLTAKRWPNGLWRTARSAFVWPAWPLRSVRLAIAI